MAIAARGDAGQGRALYVAQFEVAHQLAQRQSNLRLLISLALAALSSLAAEFV